MSTTYITPRREAVIGSRVTASDRALLEAAAAARGTTLSRYVAEVATRAARRELRLGDQCSKNWDSRESDPRTLTAE